MPSLVGRTVIELCRSSGPVSFGYAELENNNGGAGQQSLLTPSTEYPSGVASTAEAGQQTLKNELQVGFNVR